MTDENAQGKAASKAKTPATPTAYVVLEQIDTLSSVGGKRTCTDPEKRYAWVEADALTASAQEKTLIEKWAAEQKRVGTFKLVPARSWKGGVRVFEKTELTSEAIA